MQHLFLNFLALIKTKKREGERKTEILESINVKWCLKKKVKTWKMFGGRLYL